MMAHQMAHHSFIHSKHVHAPYFCRAVPVDSLGLGSCDSLKSWVGVYARENDIFKGQLQWLASTATAVCNGWEGYQRDRSWPRNRALLPDHLVISLLVYVSLT